MELRVNDYARTEDGRIGKIISKGEIKGLYFKTEPYVILDIDENKKEDCIRTLLNEIVKSSPNIIDLIEVGDLVTLTSKYCENEVYRVIHIFKDNNDTIIELDCFKDGTMFISKSEDIKSIVTREQFESMEYKVEK